MTRVVALAMAAAILAGGCGLLPKATPNPGVPCEQVYNEGTCTALIELLAKDLRKEATEVVALTILPEPSVGIQATGGATPIRVRYRLKDGSSHEAALCGGVSMEPICSTTPRAVPS